MKQTSPSETSLIQLSFTQRRDIYKTYHCVYLMYQVIMQIRVKVKRKKKTKFSPENKPVMPRIYA